MNEAKQNQIKPSKTERTTDTREIFFEEAGEPDYHALICDLPPHEKTELKEFLGTKDAVTWKALVWVKAQIHAHTPKSLLEKVSKEPDSDRRRGIVLTNLFGPPHARFRGWRDEEKRLLKILRAEKRRREFSGAMSFQFLAEGGKLP